MVSGLLLQPGHYGTMQMLRKNGDSDSTLCHVSRFLKQLLAPLERSLGRTGICMPLHPRRGHQRLPYHASLYQTRPRLTTV
jgi:hypothetical protein